MFFSNLFSPRGASAPLLKLNRGAKVPRGMNPALRHAILLLLTSIAHAETGYNAWLRYAPAPPQKGTADLRLPSAELDGTTSNRRTIERVALRTKASPTTATPDNRYSAALDHIEIIKN